MQINLLLEHFNLFKCFIFVNNFGELNNLVLCDFRGYLINLQVKKYPIGVILKSQIVGIQMKHGKANINI